MDNQQLQQVPVSKSQDLSEESFSAANEQKSPNFLPLFIILIVGLGVLSAVFFKHRQTQQSTNNTAVKNQQKIVPPVTLEECQKKSVDEALTCFQQYGMQTKKVDNCKAIQVAYQQYPCVTGVAIGLKDKSLCVSELSANFKDSCLNVYAAELNDLEACKKITGSSQQVLCNMGVAVKNNNPDLCLQLPEQSYKDSCLSEVAKTSNNISLCEKISEQQNWEICYYNVAQKNSDPGPCDHLYDSGVLYSKGACYAAVAKIKKDSSLCDKITDSFYHDSCVADSAVWDNKPLECEQVKDTGTKIGCYRITAEQLNDVSICENLNATDGWGLRDGCVSDFAKSKNKPELCGKINHVEIEEECVAGGFWADYQQQLGQPSTITDCQSGKDPLDRFNCFYNKAVVAKKYELCDQMPKDGWKDKCYRLYFDKTGDSNSCLGIRDEKEKGFCIQRWAQQTGDYSKCDLIKDQAIKNGCNPAGAFKPSDTCKQSQGQLDTKVIYDTVERVAKPGDSIVFKLNITNNDTCYVFLGGSSSAMSGSSGGIVVDSSNYANPNSGIAPGAVFKGELMTMKIPTTAKKQNIDGSSNFYLIAGDKKSEIYNQKFLIHVQP